MDWNDPDTLSSLDRAGYTVLEAITTAALPASASYSRPNAFVCVDGRTYWVKGSVQQGLVAELVASRLGSQIATGAIARIIRVTQPAVPPDRSADHLLGVVVGSEDQPGTVNARDLAPLLANAQFQPNAVDRASRARVVAFHTWLGMGDAQVLVRLTDGKVMSIDHGECFGSLTDPAEVPVVVVADIPGVGSDVGREAVHVRDAIVRIERVTDTDLARAVAQVPGGDEWRSPTDRRLAIGRWLAERRTLLREVMEKWMLP